MRQRFTQTAAAIAIALALLGAVEGNVAGYQDPSLRRPRIVARNGEQS